MAKLPKSQAPEAPSGLTTLFDPFWNSGKAWRQEARPSTPQCYVLGGADALPALQGLARQFQAPAPGWRALLLTIPGMNCQHWAVAGQTRLIPPLISSVMPLERDLWLLLLPDNRVVVVLYHPEKEGLVPLVYALSSLLTEADHAPRTQVQLADLAIQPHLLGQWAQACSAHLAAEASHASQALTAQRQQALAQLLQPLLATPRPRPLRTLPLVLVVEDDPSTALLLETLLSGAATVVVAPDALAAGQAYGRHQPDLVLLDLGLPDLSGHHVMAALRQADPSCAVVILTANATQANLSRAMQAGARGFLAKPFTREKLLDALTRFSLTKKA